VDVQVASIEAQGKCIKQSVQIAKKNVKFPSSQEKIAQSIAEIAFRSIKIAAVK
jgi:hypothetical protein